MGQQVKKLYLSSGGPVNKRMLSNISFSPTILYFTHCDDLSTGNDLRSGAFCRGKRPSLCFIRSLMIHPWIPVVLRLITF